MNFASKLNQEIVVWSASTLDKFARSSFSAGVEFVGRWRGKSVEFVGSNGEKVLSDSILHFDADDVIPTENDRAYLGTLASLTAPQQANPLLVLTSEIVRSVKQTPGIDTQQTIIKILTKA